MQTQLEHKAFLLLLALVSVAFVWLLLPFYGAVFWAVILAIVFQPLQRNLSKRRPADLIAGLMNNISTEVREGFLSYLEAQEPSLAQDVQRTMFTFDDIAVRLHGRDVAGVLRDVPEEVLLKALKLGEAQGSATVAFVLENLPRRLAERYVEELGGLEDVSRKEGEAAQIEITKAIQAQAKAGTIRFIEKDSAFG